MNAAVEILQSSILPGFPSASSVNYYNDRLYLVGDDANNILVLDTSWKQLETVPLFNYPEKRIPKAVKADLETAVVLESEGQASLLLLGSASTDERKRMIRMPLPAAGEKNDYHRFFPATYGDTFFSQLKELDVDSVNIEGATIIREHLVLGNRGNNTRTVNQLIITNQDFWQDDQPKQIAISRLILPDANMRFAGISELCYIPGKDLLLVTLSSEDTANAYDDGPVGDSYLGWIENAAAKIKAPLVMLDGLLNLSASHPSFAGEKIEGICMEKEEDQALILHLVADNDTGESTLFRLRLTFS